MELTVQHDRVVVAAGEAVLCRWMQHTPCTESVAALEGQDALRRFLEPCHQFAITARRGGGGTGKRGCEWELLFQLIHTAVMTNVAMREDERWQSVHAFGLQERFGHEVR
ncbi:MAG: hypothetical protein EXS29_04175 [Pedosphaera sp.]|nr:hypothetical protein [Pedosphaera sp.]